MLWVMGQGSALTEHFLPYLLSEFSVSTPGIVSITAGVPVPEAIVYNTVTLVSKCDN